MERHEYRAQQRNRRSTLIGSTSTVAGVGDMYLQSETGVSVLNWIYDQALTLSSTDASVLAGASGNGIAIGGGIAAVALAQADRASRNTTRAYRRRLFSSGGWTSTSDLWDFTGRPALHREARKTRPGLSMWRRVISRNPGELGIRIGTGISASSRLARGRSLYSSFEQGVLVSGEPGSWKSAFVADKLLDFPGPAVVSSTKTEFWDATSEIREHQRGPVHVFDPYADVPHADEYTLRWNLVAGCRDERVAVRRAEALMSAAAGGGVKNGDFFTGRGRALMTGLLTAADYGGVTLRAVGNWLQTESYDEPLRILKHAEKTHRIEEGLIGAVQQMVDSEAGVTSGSAAQTASQVLEFLSNPQLADALCPDAAGRTFDFDEFLRSNGTVYLVTGESATLSPIVAAFAAEMRDAAKRYTRSEGQRLDPPLGCIYDEAHLTVAGVPIHEHVAEMRGAGVWHLVAVQNSAQMREKWGEEQARTLRTCLQTHVVLATHDQDDREYWSRRIGQHTEQHVKGHTSTPNTVATRVFGNPLRKGVSESRGEDPIQVETFPAIEWSKLKPGQGVMIPNKGAAAVVSIDHGLIRAARMTTAVRADRDTADAVARATRRDPIAEAARQAEETS